mgnify:CR=1 FL=1|tara:strand:+ start:3863 stop:4039 length:177 start_codon:yes stop_codon:yes gene_type:complete
MGKDTKQPGGIPNRPYDAPKENPNNPYVPAPKRLAKAKKKEDIFHSSTSFNGEVNDNA